MPAIPLDLTLSAGEVTDPLVRPGGEWVSGVHAGGTGDDATVALRMWSVTDDRIIDLLVDPAPVTGRGSSGGAHTWHHTGGAVYVVTRSAGVVEVRVDDAEGTPVVTGVRPLALDPARAWSTPSVSADGRALLVVADWRELWEVTLDAGRATLVAAARDGYLVDADGPARRAHGWERPHMAWTMSGLTDRDPVEGVSVQQPRSTRDGATRGHISDASGVANVVLEADHIVGERTVIDDGCEHGGPVWGPGQRTWCPSPDGRRVAFTRNEAGHGALWVLDRETGGRSLLGRGVHGCLSWEGTTLAAHRTGARTPPEVVVYDMARPDGAGHRRLVAPADPRWYGDDARAEMVEPALHHAPDGEGGSVPFRLYRARRAHGGLIVWVHGGPTDQWQVSFRARHLHWLSRGWSIAVVDHRGTTGWGRAFAIALHGRWGEADARDVAASIAHLRNEHGYAPGATVLMGGSAGGLSALNAIRTSPGAVAGAVLSYPVVDLGEILDGDDPFESHHMPALIGAASRDDAVIRERSPHSHGGELAGTPMLVFHGDADTSVPVVHSERLRDAVNSAGGSCELVVLRGEGHGFRSRDNIETEFLLTERFLSRVTGG